MTLEVLHVHAGNLYGGVETILVSLARHAGAASELRHRFALCFEGRLAVELREAGARVDLLGATRVSRPWTLARGRRRLRRLLASSSVGAAVCHSAWSQAIFGPVVSRAHVPLVFWLHGALHGPAWLERWARRSAPNHAICVSRFVASYLPGLFPDVRHTVVYSPVEPTPDVAWKRREATRLSLQTEAGQVVILNAARMEEGKGHRVLLRALADLAAVPGWTCWIAGGAQRHAEHSYERGVRREALRLGLGGRVRFLGARLDLPDLLAAADLFCQPSIVPEGFGLGVVEALYAGLPVVASATGGAVEIVDDSCGVLVPPADAGAVAAALRQLVEDTGARARLASAGPARACALCEPQRQVDRLAELFREVARGRKPA